MLDFARFIGFLACHAVWSVEDGEMLTPFYATDDKGTRRLERYEGDSQTNVEKLKEVIVKNKRKFTYSLIAYDGYVTIDKVKKDSIIIEAFCSVDKRECKVIMAIPYRHAKSEKGFAIYRPKTVEIDVPDLEVFNEGFWKGVELHEKGAEVWNKYMDQSE